MGALAKVGPVSAKVSNGSLLGLVTGLVTGVLEYFIPAWHSGIPGPLQTLISAGVAAGGYLAGGWLSRHRPTVAEVEAALAEAEAIGAAAAAHPA